MMLKLVLVFLGKKPLRCEIHPTSCSTQGETEGLNHLFVENYHAAPVCHTT